MSANHRWKPQDDDDLLHLVDSGFQIDSVAWALDRSSVAVRARLAQIRRDRNALESESLPSMAESAGPV